MSLNALFFLLIIKTEIIRLISTFNPIYCLWIIWHFRGESSRGLPQLTRSKFVLWLWIAWKPSLYSRGDGDGGDKAEPRTSIGEVKSWTWCLEKWQRSWGLEARAMEWRLRERRDLEIKWRIWEISEESWGLVWFSLL